MFCYVGIRQINCLDDRAKRDFLKKDLLLVIASTSLNSLPAVEASFVAWVAYPCEPVTFEIDPSDSEILGFAAIQRISN